MRETWKRVVACILVMVLGFTSIPMDAIASEVNQQTDVIWDGTETERTYTGENYEVTFTVTGSWDSGYNAEIQIKNVGNESIENWMLEYSGYNKISNIWNAKIDCENENQYVIKNDGWNQDIGVGETVSFGLSSEEKFAGFPDKMEIVGVTIDTNQEKYSVYYDLQSDWESGYTASISITNNTDCTIEDWVLSFSFDRDITHIWNGVIESHEDNYYVIKNASYNANIEPHQTISFGFNGQGGSKETEPSNYSLTEKSYGNVHVVTFEVGKIDGVNQPAAQSVKDSEYAIEPEILEADDYICVGWYKDAQFTELFDFDTEKITKDITLYARWFNFMCEVDTDGDGIDDELELLLGTDPNQEDSDGDGLSDAVELDYLDTDPTKYDTDGNGICDADEDFDQDGISNKEEIIAGTNPAIQDTDEDGLLDGEESNRYLTNPLLADTDGDKVSDGKEVEIGSNPLLADDKFCVKMGSQENDPVTASVEITLNGEQVESLSVEAVENELLFPKTMPGYIGSAYDFYVDGSFDQATLTFEFPEAFLEQKNFDPVIYYFNEDEQILEELSTTLLGHTAVATTTHFSTYILLNRTEQEAAKIWIDNWAEGNFSGVELVLLIDDSGSMDWNDASSERLKVARDLVEQLPQGSKVGIVKFENDVTVLTEGLTEDKEKALACLTSEYYYNWGGTYMYSAIDEALSLFEDNEDDILKIAVVLSDGDAHDRFMHESVVQKANELLVELYTVGLGSESSYYFNQYLRPLANNTAGEFYLAKDAGALKKIYDSISQKIDLQTDSDGDGIADYFEDHAILFNGTQIEMDKYNADSDGDGLSDGEEVLEIKRIPNEDNTQNTYYLLLGSSPGSKDSDHDGLFDNMAYQKAGKVIAPKDPDPLIYNGYPGMWKNHINSMHIDTVATQYGSEGAIENGRTAKWLKKELEKAGVKDEQIALADTIVRMAFKLESKAVEHKRILSIAVRIIKKFTNTKIQTILGAYVLNFVQDADGVAYHSQIDTWQRYWGYNNLYDIAFGIDDQMNTQPIKFEVQGNAYVLWLWKGDYWNLHSGAEMGLYTNAVQMGNNTQYHAIDFEVPMTLSLYNYERSNHTYKNVFHWYPEVKQWWITGFSGYRKEFLHPNCNKMITVNSVDLSGYPQIYKALKDRINRNSLTKTRLDGYECIFDDNNCIVWINWYQGVRR